MKNQYDVIVCGAYFMDLIFTGFPRMPHPGEELYGTGFTVRPGGGYNTILALHRLGVKAGWAVDLGNDIWSRMVIAEAEEEGIDTSLFVLHKKPLRSVTVSVGLPDDRGFITYMDPDPAIPAAVKAISRSKTRILFIPALYYGPFFAIGEKAVRKNGTLLFMDGNSSSGTIQGTKGIGETLKRVDVFLPNGTEALRLTGKDPITDADRRDDTRGDMHDELRDDTQVDIRSGAEYAMNRAVRASREAQAACEARTAAEMEALSALSVYTSIVVMKRGKEGAAAIWNNRKLSIQAPPISTRSRARVGSSADASAGSGAATNSGPAPGTNPAISSRAAIDIDTTGAGDFFDAGFMKGWLDGKEPEECLAWGVAAGSAAVSCADEKRKGFSLERVARDTKRIMK